MPFERRLIVDPHARMIGDRQQHARQRDAAHAIPERSPHQPVTHRHTILAGPLEARPSIMPADRGRRARPGAARGVSRISEVQRRIAVAGPAPAASFAQLHGRGGARWGSRRRRRPSSRCASSCRRTVSSVAIACAQIRLRRRSFAADRRKPSAWLPPTHSMETSMSGSSATRPLRAPARRCGHRGQTPRTAAPDDLVTGEPRGDRQAGKPRIAKALDCSPATQ